jgi:hypothetical protein
MSDRPSKTAELPVGYDQEEPYEGPDLSEYPIWWQRNIRAFKEHSLRPYRPSRFADGEIVQSLRDELETELSISIALRKVGSDPEGNWQVCVDGDFVRPVSRWRTESGFTQYKIDSDTFERCIRNALRSIEP